MVGCLWIMSWKGYGRKRSCTNLRHYPGTDLEGLRKNTKNFSSNILSPGRDLNLEPFEYEAGCFTKHRKPTDLYNGYELCFLRGTNIIIKYCLNELRSVHQTYLYLKDERALPGDLRSRKSKFIFPPPVKSSAYRYPPPPTFSSLSLFLLLTSASCFHSTL
jgi:hypothetical protein